MGTITRLAAVRPVMTLRSDVSGRVVPVGHTVKWVEAVAPVEVKSVGPTD